MEIKNLLPIGSVVLLKGAEKKLMIIGVKQTNTDTGTEYDYLSVLYPEGNLGGESQVMFNHEDIQDIFFRGYEDEEREEFLQKLEEFYS
jgi:hypothetical protein